MPRAKRSPLRAPLFALWAALLLQAVAAAWQAGGADAFASLVLAGGALVLFALSARTVAARRGVTLVGAWALWFLLVGSTAQLAAVTWSLGLGLRLVEAAGAVGFHLLGSVFVLLGLVTFGLHARRLSARLALAA